MPVVDVADIAGAAAEPSTTGPRSAGGAKATSSRGKGERRDRVPKASPTKRGAATGAAVGERKSAETKAIGAALGQLLSMPGIVFGMMGDPFLGDQLVREADGEPGVIPGHFSKAGPALGMQIAAASETNPQLRRILKRIIGGDSMALLLLGLFTYAVPPVVYLMTPNGAPLRSTLHVPDRPRKEAPAYAPDSETAGDPEPEVEA